MLKSLKIKNIQSHKDSFFEFDKGLNVFTGITESGKSAVLRSLKLVLYNQRPKGTTFRSTWGGLSFSEVETFEGDSVRRELTDKGNRYYLNGEEFKAFGTKVPDEIVKILNVNEINFQKQFTYPFLLGEDVSDGKIASFFNKLAKLEKIDISISKIKKRINSNNKLIKIRLQDIKKNKKRLKNLTYLTKAETLLTRTEKIEAKIKEQTIEVVSILNIINSFNKIQEDKKETQKLLKLENRVNKIVKITENMEGLYSDISSISTLITGFVKIQKEKEQLQKLTKYKATINKTIQLVQQIENEELDLNSIKDTISRFNNNKEDKSRNKKVLNKLEKQWHKNMSGKCPLCGK